MLNDSKIKKVSPYAIFRNVDKPRRRANLGIISPHLFLVTSFIDKILLYAYDYFIFCFWKK